MGAIPSGTIQVSDTCSVVPHVQHQLTPYLIIEDVLCCRRKYVKFARYVGDVRFFMACVFVVCI